MNGSDLLIWIILFAAAFLPPVIYIIWIRNTERYEREPWSRIFGTFIWGAVFGVILGILFSVILISVFDIILEGPIYEAISEDDYLGTLFLVCVIAPLGEEAAKGLGVFTAGRDLDEVEDGLIYGASVGLGFAATENLLYGYLALREGTGLFIATMVVRTISSALLHASATSATGYGIGKKKILGRGNYILPYYFLAVLMHATFNFFASMQSFLSLFLAIAFAIGAIEFTRHKIQQLDVSHVMRDEWRKYM
jgi:RsiW-degrading membrane proteinase PrsW (M82 family)